MNPTCEKCGGECCKWVTATVPPDEEWALTRGVIVNGAWEIRSICRHLKDGKCRIYEKRPQSCRDCAVNSEQCIEARNLKTIVSNSQL